MDSLRRVGQDGAATVTGTEIKSGGKAGMRDPKNMARGKGVWHPGKRDGKVLREEAARNTAEDTTNMRGIDAATSADTFQTRLDSAQWRYYQCKMGFLISVEGPQSMGPRIPAGRTRCAKRHERRRVCVRGSNKED